MPKASSNNESSAQWSETTSRSGSWRNAFVLMRIPFSVFLMPVFWFALSNAGDINGWNAFWTFIIIHVFLYPASNGYNSFFDRDDSSIGGLESPPPVSDELFRLVMIFDGIAILGAWLISPVFSMLALIYTLVSKAYSFDKIRLKQFPLISTAIVTIFQGAFTYFMVLVGIGESIHYMHVAYAVISTFLISGSFPLTQIYQHKEDEERGDKTISIKLGIKGTFVFSALMFAFGFSGMMFCYYLEDRFTDIVLITIAASPIVFYFIRWMWLSWNDEDHVNYRNTMNMNAIASLALSGGFIVLLLIHHYG